MGFQTQVNLQQAPAVAGDFASTNPRASVIAPEGGFVAGAGGVNVATFAWVQSNGTTLLNADASAAPDGFVPREQQALIVTYLAEAGNNIPVGFGVTLMRTGDYWFTPNVNAAVKGQKVFAKLTDGTTRTGAAGATIAGYVETNFVVSVPAGTGELAVMSL